MTLSRFNFGSISKTLNFSFLWFNERSESENFGESYTIVGEKSCQILGKKKKCVYISIYQQALA